MKFLSSNTIIRIVFSLCFVTNSISTYVYETKYIDVPLDHFSFNDNRTFQLKYLVNDSYWKPNRGPIFFYTGNEGSIEIFAQNTGFLWESAAIFHALVVFAEHRYYGTSLPFGSQTFTEPKYFGYLNSEQALADFVDVIYHIRNFERPRKTKHKYKKLNPVIAFGGSYGGMLAAWMRMKYPAVVEGALASSAPIWQFTNMTSCNAFYERTTIAYNYSSPQCVSNIRKSWNAIKNLTTSKQGKDWISKSWKLCSPIKTETDADTLTDWLIDVYVSLAMINYPYPTEFLMPVPANPVKEMCSYLNYTSLSDKELLMAVFEAISVYFNYTGSSPCLQWNASAEGDIDVNGWNIQSCNEMVMPMCSNGNTDMFTPSEWNFEDYSNACYNKYNIHPKENMAEKMYGGKDINGASNIIFSNGLWDPWMSGGVTHTISPSVIAIILSESAHHLDLRSANKNDPASVVEARKYYNKSFRKWIHAFYKKHRNFDSKYTMKLF